jgi:type IV pilus assembly protein PilQ
MGKRIAILLLLILVLPGLAYGQLPRKAVTKLSFDFFEADVKNVLRILSEITDKNVVVADDVKGKVTMKLENVTWEEALDVVIRNTDLAKFEDRSVIRIVTLKRYSEERERERKERIEFLKERQEKLKQGEELVTETIFLNYTTAAEVEKVIKAQVAQAGTGPQAAAVTVSKGLLSEFGSITAVSWTNALIIRDTKENVAQIIKLIKEHDFAPPQVQIEARIVQASSNFSRELGIQWGANYKWNSRAAGNKDVELTGGRTGAGTPLVGEYGTRDTEKFPYLVNLPAAVSSKTGGALGIFLGSVEDSFKLDIQLSALENDGKGKIISNPKVITSDNKPAIIKQGQQIPYQTVSQSGTQTEFKDAVLSLEVTPQVTKDNNIKLKIKATKDRPLFSTTPPTIDKKEATTEVIVRDGETAVIGGIYEVTDDSSEAMVPFLGKIPGLGWLFKKESKTMDKQELLIFITPVIVKSTYRQEG